MRIFVTGGSGFIGSHTVARLVRRGHAVKLMVRNTARVPGVLGVHGVKPGDVEVVGGDVTDQAAVREAMRGAQAVLHAAAIYSLDVARAKEIHRINAAATKAVLGAAVEARIDPIVYLSSYVALLPPSGDVITADAPVGRPKGAYAVSKAAAERVARAHQQASAPITSLFPGTVWGPHDPGGADSDSMRTGALLLRNQTPFAFRGGIPIVDVRTVAAAIESALEAGRGPRRYLLGGTFVSWEALARILRGLTGRALPQLPTPLALAKLSGRLVDALRPLMPRRPAFGFEGPWYLDVSRPLDDTRTLAELGIAHPPVADTIADQVRWMAASGIVTGKQAGALGPADAALLEGERPATQVTQG